MSVGIAFAAAGPDPSAQGECLAAHRAGKLSTDFLFTTLL